MDATLIDDPLLVALIEALPIGVVLSDRNGVRVIANKLAVELLGNAVTGRGSEAAPPHSLYRPDGTPLRLEELPLWRALDTGQASEGVEILLRDVDGARGIVERYVRCSGAPVRGQGGQIVYGIMALQDTTEEERSAVAAERGRLARELHDSVSSGPLLRQCDCRDTPPPVGPRSSAGEVRLDAATAIGPRCISRDALSAAGVAPRCFARDQPG